MKTPAIDRPVLPAEYPTAGEAVAAWAVTEPRFRAMLDAGIPVARALNRHGRRLLQENRLDEAVEGFRLATLVAPNDPDCWINYGVLLDRTNALPEAIVAIERSLTLASQKPDTWLVLGMLRAKRGLVEAAEAAYMKVLDLDRNSAIAWQCLGLLNEGIRHYQEAIDCFQTCIQRGGASAPLWANLGKLLQQRSRMAESCHAYGESVRLDGDNPRFRDLLRQACFLREVFEGRPIEPALAAYRESALARVPTEHDLVELSYRTFNTLAGFGHVEAASRLGRKHLELWPDSPSMKYLLEAVHGTSGVDRSPPSFIAEHFDAFAEGFDAQLVGMLGYDLPEKLCAAVQAATPPGRRYDALDAGCGTGLCAARLVPLVRTLVGVDLSPKMLIQAAKRDIYDELVCADLMAFLDRGEGRFDLVVAADVMIYFGNLAPFFAAAARALRPGGLLAFSTEFAPEGNYQLRPSGRFAHSVAYVRGLAGTAFEEQACLSTTLRWEATARVPGQIFVFRRRK